MDHPEFTFKKPKETWKEQGVSKFQVVYDYFKIDTSNFSQVRCNSVGLVKKMAP